MKPRLLVLLVFLFMADPSFAGVDKVYSPLVELGEFELEMRGLIVVDSDASLDGAQKAKLGLGYGITSRIFIEGYVEFEKPADGSYELEAYEFEAKFQLSEQGQYFADFGLLTELERVRSADEWEFKIGPLIEKQMGTWLGTLNLFGETKFGSDVGSNGEWELLHRMQIRYLSSPRLEPGLEYYGDENTRAIGPTAYGRIDFRHAKILWQAGWMLGLDSGTADHTIRWQFEWEF